MMHCTGLRHAASAVWFISLAFQSVSCRSDGGRKEDNSSPSASEKTARNLGTYFDQELPEEIPVPFAEAVLSRFPRAWGVVFSPDLKGAMFNTEIDNQFVIVVSIYIHDHWTDPGIAPFVTEKHMFMYPGIDSAGSKVYFCSNLPPNQSERSDVLGIWYSEKEENGWGHAKHVGYSVNTGIETCPRIVSDGRLFFHRRDQGIFISKEGDNGFQAANPIDRTINLQYKPGHFYPASDGSFLIFDSIHRDGLGKMDLYITFMNPDSSWSVPKNMGEPINSGEHDSHPTLSPDGRYLFFASTRSGRKLFWVDIEKTVENLRSRLVE